MKAATSRIHNMPVRPTTFAVDQHVREAGAATFAEVADKIGTTKAVVRHAARTLMNKNRVRFEERTPGVVTIVPVPTRRKLKVSETVGGKSKDDSSILRSDILEVMQTMPAGSTVLAADLEKRVGGTMPEVSQAIFRLREEGLLEASGRGKGMRYSLPNNDGNVWRPPASWIIITSFAAGMLVGLFVMVPW